MQSEQTDATLLVVDDDRVTRMTISKVLKSAGYQVVEASNGLEAIAMVAEQRPALVLMDVQMPQMDGYAACEALRQSHDHQILPILMLTGLNETESIDQAFDSGATDFITKPINWTLLTQRVRYALRTRAMGITLHENQLRLSQAQKIAKLGYWELDLNSKMVHCSDELLSVMGLDPRFKVDSLDTFLQMVPEEERRVVQDAIDEAIITRQPYDIEHRVKPSEQSEITVHQQGQVVLDENDRPRLLVGTLQDVSERKAAEKLIEYQAYYDTLTDLPNRRLFTDHVSHALQLIQHQHSQVAVLFIGLDRFKVVNDTMGHAAGDRLLQDVAGRLKNDLDDGVSLARFGADVFAVLLEGLSRRREIDAYIERIMTQLARPFVVMGQEFFLTVSIGVALSPHDGDDAGSLLKAADSAMFQAKQEGGQQYHYFTAELNALAQQRLQMENELRKALENNEFQLFYQPQVNASSREIVGMEALIRWIHPQRGMVSPLEFIPVAEDSGLIIPIGEWVLRTACRQTQEWNEKFGLNLRVGVNLSARQFSQADLIGDVGSALEESGLPGTCLDLEVTESIAMENIDSCISTLKLLQRMGIHASMDDFGTGYSSLSYLRQMPLHTLKIDRAFIKDIKSDGENGEIARAIIAMAHSLKMQVVAEGVETEGQLNYLNEHGCDLIQGFYISKPLEQEAFEKMLEAGQG